MSKNKAVRILNPKPDSPTHTNLRSANRLVRVGRAFWVGSSIKLHGNPDLEQRDLVSLMRHTRLRTMDEAGYDAIGQMTLPQIQGLPLAGPAQKLVQKGTARIATRMVKYAVSKHVHFEE